MIRKFAAVSAVRKVLSATFLATIFAGAAVHAQQTPAQQTPDQQTPAQPTSPTPAQPSPDTQQSSSQESSSQEPTTETIHRKVKPREYKNWTFNVDGGESLINGTTNDWVRGGGGIAAAGAARNYSKYFGFRLDFQFDNLPLRNSALEQAQAPGANSHVYSLMLDPIINIPVSKVWSAYVVFGPSYLHRSGKLDSSTALPGAACNPFFEWWGRCVGGSSLPLNGDFLHSSENQFGYNLGAGIARKIRSNLELYAEFRQVHGTHNGITTDLRPITVGVRWGK
jgi:opacity protein-like surface antigen